MSGTIAAIYEHGVFRPLDPVSLPEGERVSIELWPGAPACNATLDRIAKMVIVRKGDHFSGEDHDKILYGGE